MLILFGGVGAWFFLLPVPVQDEVMAEEPPPPQEAPADGFKLPEIVEHPESDGVRPPENPPLSVETESDYSDAETVPVAVTEAPPPETSAPKKLPKPVLVKKIINNKLPQNPFSPDVPVATDTRTVDLLIVYTADVKKRLGGHKGVLARANEVVAYTNFKFHERKVQGTLRLVGLVETEYVPPTEGDIVKHGLGAVSSGYATCGGKKESVHKIRNKVGADLVCMWVAANRGGGGGLAQIHGPWSSMNLPVTSIFRHEMAHNFGWNHDDRQNYSMIHKNFPGMARWVRKKIAKDKLYVQYVTEYEETGD
ncbi:MAG: hypothetical protein LBG65_04855 [Puniceicoccales bacterium]|nr:hypothetical protein [Puniceicoccales bacterium]